MDFGAGNMLLNCPALMCPIPETHRAPPAKR